MNALSAIPAIIEGTSQLYNLYKGSNMNTGKKLGINANEVRFLGAYNNKGRKLATFYKK